MPRCTAKKPSGEQCGAFATRGGPLCHFHQQKLQDGPAAERHKADIIADAIASGLSFSCAADVKAFMEAVMAATMSNKIPAGAAQPLNSMCRTLLATFFAGEDDLSAVPDAIKALTTAELYEQMAKALPTPVLRKELSTR